MVSLVITTYNEENSIEKLLQDILNQTLLPNELIVVDAGSWDQTCHILNSYKDVFRKKSVNMMILSKTGANIAQGRNIGIAAATGPVIAVTDAGCRLAATWLETLVKPISEGVAELVGGFYLPLISTRFHRALAAVITAPQPPKGFLPSSRSVAFLKSLWEKVGGYSEWLPWGEDTQFNLDCLRSGARYVVAKEALVYWNMRSNLKEVAKQYFRYAYGDGMAFRLSRSYFVIQVVCWGSLTGSFIWGPQCLIPVMLYPFAKLLYRQVVFRPVIKFADLPIAFLIALTIELSHFAGFIWGILFRCGRHDGT